MIARRLAIQVISNWLSRETHSDVPVRVAANCRSSRRNRTKNGTKLAHLGDAPCCCEVLSYFRNIAGPKDSQK
jgi:hypothetical protein